MGNAPLIFLDVDTQRDFLLDDGALPVPEGKAVIPIIQRLVGHAFTHDVPVVSTMDCHVRDDPEFADFPPHCVKGTRGQLKIDGTTLGNALIVTDNPDAPPDDEAILAARQIIIEKGVLDVFETAHAERVLDVLGPRLVIVFGVATEYCVRLAVLGLCARGYRTIVVRDAVAGVDALAARSALTEMRRAGATFITGPEILARADPTELSV